MTHMWGPGLDAEVEYRRDKLAHVAARGRSSRRWFRRAAAPVAGPAIGIATTQDGARSVVAAPAKSTVAGSTSSRAA